MAAYIKTKIENNNNNNNGNNNSGNNKNDPFLGLGGKRGKTKQVPTRVKKVKKGGKKEKAGTDKRGKKKN